MAPKYGRYVVRVLCEFLQMEGFMIQVRLCLSWRSNLYWQTGDPSGTGKGGQSIWGEPFQDEIRATLKVCPVRQDIESARIGVSGMMTLTNSFTRVGW